MTRTIKFGLLGIFALGLSGCGGGSGGGATPEATYENLKSAALKKDWNGFVSCFSPDTLDDMLVGVSIGAKAETSDKNKGLKEIMDKHGLKPIDIKDLMTATPDKSKPDPKAQVTAGVKDKVACLGEIMNWLEKSGDKDFINSMNTEEIAASKISDVKIDGDKATAQISKKDGKTNPAQFKKVNGKWLIDTSGKM